MDAPGSWAGEGVRGAAQETTRDTTPIGRRALLVGASAAAAVFAVAAAFALSSSRTLDVRALTWLAERRSPGLTSFSELLGVLGSSALLTPLSILIVALLFGLGRRRSALLVGLCMVAEVVLNQALKSLFGLARPSADLAVKQFSGLGFPSGHAMAAATLSLALVMVAWPTRWRRLALAGAVVWMLLIGLSRVYLGAHWPADVAGGWAAGAALAFGLGALIGVTSSPEPESRSSEAEAASQSPQTQSAGTQPIRVVLFDWGNTLMVDDGRKGPMAGWPRVAAVPGAAQALAALHGRYLVCVATNADDSGADEVTAALGRVGLARFIDRVFSSRDIGARKPDPAFYAAVLDALGAETAACAETAGGGGTAGGGAGAGPAARPLCADQVVMVGDNFDNDIAGAMAAGLKAVWFNPGRTPLPTGRTVSDAEIRTLADLPSVLTRV